MEERTGANFNDKGSKGTDKPELNNERTTTNTPDNPTTEPHHRDTPHHEPIESYTFIDEVPDEVLEKWAKRPQKPIASTPKPIYDVRRLATFVSEQGVEALSGEERKGLHPQAKRILTLLSESRKRRKGLDPIPYVACPAKERNLLF